MKNKINIILGGLLIVVFLIYYLQINALREGSLVDKGMLLMNWLDKASPAMSDFT